MQQQYNKQYASLFIGLFFLLLLMACDRNVDQEYIDDEEVEVEDIIDLEEHEEANIPALPSRKL